MKKFLLNNVPIIGSLIFLSLVLTLPGIINLIFYSIHEAFFRKIIGEGTFIIIGDILLALLVYWGLKKFVELLVKIETKEGIKN